MGDTSGFKAVPLTPLLRSLSPPSSPPLRSLPQEGVYIHGLFLDGAAWSNSRTLVESAPKKLFAALPVVLVTAVTKTAKKTLLASGDYGPFGGFDCPVYKYPQRTDRYIVFTVTLPTQDLKPIHWTLRGVALLCATG